MPNIQFDNTSETFWNCFHER